MITVFSLIIIVTPCFSQSSGATGDTSKVKQEQVAAGNQEGTQNQIRNQVQNRNQAGNQAGDIAQQGTPGGKNGEVKQIRSSRPDMSKARSARPPQITRPSGSAIPKGMGKPGGAMRRGGR